MVLQIVILAMVAAFLGLRLYSVLGRRAEHEEEILGDFPRPGQDREPGQTVADPLSGISDITDAIPDRALVGIPVGAQRAIREVAAAERGFSPVGFVVGAKAAYAMVLEAFWKGDKDTLNQLCDDDVYASFAGAIDAREAAGEVVENKLIRINEAEIVTADYEAPLARVTVRFSADIAALTRDKDGNMVAGSLDDAVESHDVWTFSRRLGSSRPDWLLDETDEG